jgi:hypothetical protein
MENKVALPSEARYEASAILWARSPIYPKAIVHCTDPMEMRHVVRLTKWRIVAPLR